MTAAGREVNAAKAKAKCTAHIIPLEGCSLIVGRGIGPEGSRGRKNFEIDCELRRDEARRGDETDARCILFLTLGAEPN